MKASELVEKLQKMIEEHGDLVVESPDTYCGNGHYNPVTNVTFKYGVLLIDIYED